MQAKRSYKGLKAGKRLMYKVTVTLTPILPGAYSDSLSIAAELGQQYIGQVIE